MDRERHARLQDLFLEVSGLPSQDREAFLVEACADDSALRADVERLLAAHDDAATFLEHDRRVAPIEGRTAACPRCGARYPMSHRFCELDGEPLEEDPQALVGTIVDGLYYVEALLGRGGMGTVYRARHTLLQDVVALKLLPRAVSDDPTWLGRFQREGQAARRFRHPNAVAVHDLRVAQDGTVYLVLEFVEGRTLRAELRGRSRMSASWAVSIVGPLASALDAAHAAGVVHRDVKPENVMLGTAGATGGNEAVVKLLDLGVAKMLGGAERDSAPVTRAGAMLGTPRYMSPEQWGEPQRDGGCEIDGRADVYSLGVMVYEMVCGQPPYRGDSWQALRQLHVSGTTVPAHVRVPELPEAFGRAISRAMAKDRAERFATAGEFAKALAEAIVATGPQTYRIDAATRAVEVLTGEMGNSTGEGLLTTGEVDARTEANPPTNLPEQLTSFVGREREIEDIRNLLDRARLVTLTGPGGMGKTRLAVRAAREVLDRIHGGVWFVDLAPLMDPNLVAQAVASALQVRERPDIPSTDLLREHIGAKRLLLVLDNCEHLAPACAELASNLLGACPELRILATSREVLEVAGEAVWQAPPLGEREAVRLFAERARAVRQSFAMTERNEATIAELCGRLEGIPLAVELAAARSGVLTPAQMLERLGGRLDLLATRQTDVPLRHRTLRASIEWSYGLLDEAERQALAALSIFRGGWTLDAAEEVIGSSDLKPTTDNRHPTTSVLDLLESLRAASLIVSEERGEEMRYRMLETIREYASERLEPEEQKALARRHAEYFAGLAERAEPYLEKADLEWAEQLEAEQDNIRAALDRCWSGEADAETGLRIVASWRHWWAIRARLAEGRAAIEAALDRCPDGPPRLRAKALSAASGLCIGQSDFGMALAYEEAALALWRELGDRTGVAWSLHRLANVAFGMSEYERTAAFLEETYALACELDDRELIASTVMRRGMIAQNRGEYAAAVVAYEEALGRFRVQGRRQMIVAVLYCLADTHLSMSEFERAEVYYEEALGLAREGNQPFQIAGLVLSLGDLKRYTGEYDRAEALCTEGLERFSAIGARASVSLALHMLGAISRAKGDYGRAAERLHECLAVRAKSGSRRFIADTFEELAAVAAATGRAEGAARLLGAAEALREALGTPVAPADAPTLEATSGAARSALGDAAYEAAHAQGRALPFDDAAAEGLAIQ